MKVIDILKEACNMLGLTKEQEILISTTEQTEATATSNQTINRLYDLFQFSIQELCSNYVPMLTESEIEVDGTSFAIKQLTNCIRVVNVTQNGQIVKHKMIGRNLNLPKPGKYLVKYQTFPTFVSLFEELDFLNNFNPDVLVFGLCAYFCLATGLFENYENYHNAYVERAESLKNLRVFDLPRRRWE